MFGVLRLDDYVQILEKEINIDFCCAMNRIIFDKTVNEDPVTFAFVTLPERQVDIVPDKGRAQQTSTITHSTNCLQFYCIEFLPTLFL